MRQCLPTLLFVGRCVDIITVGGHVQWIDEFVTELAHQTIVLA